MIRKKGAEFGLRVQGFTEVTRLQKQPPPLGPPKGPRHGPTVESEGGAVSYERSTPVH